MTTEASNAQDVLEQRGLLEPSFDNFGGIHAIALYELDSEGRPFGEVTRLFDEKDAVRLVACWNACHGLTTEDIESLSNGGVKIQQDRHEEQYRQFFCALYSLVYLKRYSEEHGKDAQYENAKRVAWQTAFSLFDSTDDEMPLEPPK